MQGVTKKVTELPSFSVIELVSFSVSATLQGHTRDIEVGKSTLTCVFVVKETENNISYHTILYIKMENTDLYTIKDNIRLYFQTL